MVIRLLAMNLLNYGFSVALAWLLAPHEFADFAILQALLWLGAMTLNSGFPWTLAWTVARQNQVGRDTTNAVFRTSLIGNVAFGFFVGLLCLALSLSGALPSHGDATRAFAIATICFPFFALNSVWRGAMQGATRFSRLAVFQVLEVAVKCVIVLPLVAAFGLGLTAVSLGFVLGAVASSFVGALYLRDLVPGPGPLAPLHTYVSTVPMFIGAAGFALLVTIDLLALRVFGTRPLVTSTTIAIYQVGALLARSAYFVGDALIDGAFPHIARSSDSREESHGYFSGALRSIAIVTMPVQVVLLIDPKPLLELFFPAAYAAAVPVTRILAMGSVGAIAMTTFGKSLQALGRRRAVAQGVLVGLVVEGSLLYPLISLHGGRGAAIAFASGSWAGASVLGLTYFAHQRPPAPARSTVGRLAAALVVLAGACFLAALASSKAALAVMLVGAAAYVYAVVRLRLIEPEEVRRAGAAAAAVLPPRFRTWAPSAGLRFMRFAKAPFAIAGFVLASLLITVNNIGRSPDTLYDEAVYTSAARNVAHFGRLTWNGSPLFVHPPLFFLVQAAWLRLVNASHDYFGTVRVERLLTSTFTAINVGLIMLLTLELARAARMRRPLLVACAAGAVATFDPVLLRYGRLDMIESLAVLVSLLTLLVAWKMRRRSGSAWVGAVGCMTGISLLVKEVSIFLLVVPLLFAVLERRWGFARRAFAALGVGVVLWSTFFAWSLSLGQTDRFVQEKLLTVDRLLGTYQLTGWNRPGVSFFSGLRVSTAQYWPSYLLLAAGACVLAWLWLRRSGEAASFLVAWLSSTYAFGAYTVTRGQLNEQFFTYLIPGATVGTVLAAAVLLSRVRSAWKLDIRGFVIGSRALAAPAILLVLIALGGAANWWRYYHAGSDNGIRRAAQYLALNTPSCSVYNASGDLQKYQLALPGRRLTQFASGPRAVSRGVHYFFLNPKDIFARYGRMTPDFANWIRANGTELASYPSHTYWRVELWKVVGPRVASISDVQSVPGGVFVNVKGSACGGYPVRGPIYRAFHRLGGLAALGKPTSNVWATSTATFQAFERGVLVAANRFEWDGRVWHAGQRNAFARTLQTRNRTTFDAWSRDHPTDAAILGGAVRVKRVPLLSLIKQRRPEVLRRLASVRQTHVSLTTLAASAGVIPRTAQRLAAVPNLDVGRPPKHLPAQVRLFVVLFAFALVALGAVFAIAVGVARWFAPTAVALADAAESPSDSDEPTQVADLRQRLPLRARRRR